MVPQTLFINRKIRGLFYPSYRFIFKPSKLDFIGSKNLNLNWRNFILPCLAWQTLGTVTVIIGTGMRTRILMTIERGCFHNLVFPEVPGPWGWSFFSVFCSRRTDDRLKVWPLAHFYFCLLFVNRITHTGVRGKFRIVTRKPNRRILFILWPTDKFI